MAALHSSSGLLEWSFVNILVNRMHACHLNAVSRSESEITRESFWPGYNERTKSGEMELPGISPARKNVRFVIPTAKTLPSFSMFPRMIGTLAVALARIRSSGLVKVVILYGYKQSVAPKIHVSELTCQQPARKNR